MTLLSLTTVGGVEAPQHSGVSGARPERRAEQTERVNGGEMIASNGEQRKAHSRFPQEEKER